ncbi:UrcA family protein [Qipengyuania sp. JC766]|uniref:UrcA family protein n=1 Tax=Qipengyuania sp. JC766 TaxID=3232139 RepID=UPI00345A1095
MLSKTLMALSMATALVAPAMAADMTIEFRDLDLATEQGQKTLERRIDRAAREICGLDDTTLGTRIRDRESRQCYTRAKASAERQVTALIGKSREA